MLKVISGNSFEYIVCTRQQEWHVVKLRQALLIKTQIVEIWITA
jgi:hypothetical protein